MRLIKEASLVLGMLVLSMVPAMAASIPVSGNITFSETWTADNEYVLTQVIYVENGATLTIEPGTVVRGEAESAPGANDPGALVVARGAKIRALGTELAPIVFTDEFDDNIGHEEGSFPYDTVENALDETGNWGGVILLGRGWVANNTVASPDPTREVQIEGLTAAGGLGLYGNCAAVHPGDPMADPSWCDDDDSGAMRYVSIRYGGFNLSANNEINGLTLGAVGRSTDLDFIEVFQNKDDGVEFFGGAAQIKHLVVANVGDDMVDYDEGWRGKIQYVFALQGIPGTGADKSDKGGEHDGGNSPDDSQPYAIPTFYNATYIGHGQKGFDGADKNTVLHIRDNAGSRYYNSAFLDFGGATVLIEGLAGSTGTSAERAVSAYSSVFDNEFHVGPSSDFQLELEDNTFYCVGRQETMGDGSLCTAGCTTYGGSSGKDHFDNGLFTNPSLDNSYLTCSAALPIRTLVRDDLAFDPAVPDQTIIVDPRPAAGSPLLITDRTAPDDGFFDQVAYQGAFLESNWAEGWTALSRVGYFPAPTPVAVTANISTSQIWTADNVYELDQVIYVENGATLTIEPCTVIRSQPESAPGANDPGALVIARGSKINAVGTEDCPIVFTDLNDDNVNGNPGSFPYDTVENALDETGNWGGVILLGRGWVANNTAASPDPSREVQIEGLTAAGGLGLYGNCAAVHPGDPMADPSWCDDDDSGAMHYVSIRYGGFNLSANNEINGLTLGAVGRSTDLDFIEVLQNKDDGIEFFGGAAQIKHLAIANVGDDMVDYDEGWRGKIQYVFALQGIPGTGADKSDKGGEHDGGNSPDDSQPYAIPTIYNATYIGHGQKGFDGADKNTVLHIRDNAGSRYYNSAFLDFGGATVLIEGLAGSTGTSAERAVSAYSSVFDNEFHVGPSSDFQLELEDNTFYCVGRQEAMGDGSLCTAGCTTYGGSSGKDHFDNELFTNTDLNNDYLDCGQSLPIRTLVREDLALDPAVPDQTVSVDPRPAAGSALRASDRAQVDGFFSPAPYQGAFAPGNNWASCWTGLSRLGYFPVCDLATAPDAIPDDTSELFFLSKTKLVWEGPTCGINVQAYDLLRSADAADFAAATFVEEDDTDLFATDGETPANGSAFFYLTRGRNDCGAGSLGITTNGAERTAP